jgi:hypothetical protein
LESDVSIATAIDPTIKYHATSASAHNAGTASIQAKNLAILANHAENYKIFNSCFNRVVIILVRLVDETVKLYKVPRYSGIATTNCSHLPLWVVKGHARNVGMLNSEYVKSLVTPTIPWKTHYRWFPILPEEQHNVVKSSTPPPDNKN